MLFSSLLCPDTYFISFLLFSVFFKITPTNSIPLIITSLSVSLDDMFVAAAFGVVAGAVFVARQSCAVKV